MGPQLGVILLVVGCAMLCDGLPDGAPNRICRSMTPDHKGLEVQHSEHKYVVEAIKMKNGRVRVRISSEIGDEVQGFALQARSALDRNEPVEGHFAEVDGVTRTVDCFRGADNMLTHVQPNNKREVVTEWSPNVREDVDVIFRATIAKNFATFWTEVDSDPIRIISPVSTSARTKEKEKMLKKKMEEQAYAKVFEDCFKHKGCFGMPAGCISLKTCLMLLTYATTPNGVTFKLHSRLRTRSYMAAAFSTDSKMGDDLVFECIRMDAAEVVMRESWNTGKRNTVNYELIGRQGRGNYLAKYIDGVLTCSWDTNLSFDHNGVHFDLENSTYVLLSEGPMNIDQKGIHRNKIASPSPVNFTAFELLGSAGLDEAIKVHGALMVTAWIGFVSLGIIIARYFKDAWPDKTLCNKKVWFALHRCCMLLALFCVGISVIVIFVHYNGWNSGNSHSIMGVITVVLGFFQPIIANFRPDPESPKRRIFNWLHMSVGTLAHVFSLITLYIASKMESARLDRSFYWVLTIFVVVYLFFHVMLQGHLWKTKKRRINEINMLNMNRNREMDHSVVQKTDDKSIFHVVFRIMLLCIYSIVLVALVVSLHVLIARS